MPFRHRLTLMSAAVVGLVVAIASLVCYLAMRSELRGQVDEALRNQAALIDTRMTRLREPRPRFPGAGFGGGLEIPAPPTRRGGGADYVQLVGAGGGIRPGLGRDRGGADDLSIPVDDRDREIAATGGLGVSRLRDADAAGTHLRVLTLPLGEVGAIQLARTLESEDSALARLRLVLLALLLGGTAAAAALARLFSRPVMAPITELTETAEHIESTGDLDRRVGAGGDDEVGRMAGAFDQMLDRLQTSQEALASSLAAQRQLVADASHELRTPVTSLRTNAELLRDTETLGAEERRAIAGDVVAGAEELSLLVADVIDLARGEVAPAEPEDVRLDDLVREAVERARRHAPATTFTLTTEPVSVDGVPDRLARAVNNLLDNAAKYGPDGGTVDVWVTGAGEVRIRDHGPGIPADELPHVFDRFYRGTGVRRRAGSGLGLAIVAQVAAAHGGTVELEPAAGGGTVARLRLPLASADGHP